MVIILISIFFIDTSSPNWKAKIFQLANIYVHGEQVFYLVLNFEQIETELKLIVVYCIIRRFAPVKYAQAEWAMAYAC